MNSCRVAGGRFDDDLGDRRLHGLGGRGRCFGCGGGLFFHRFFGHGYAEGFGDVRRKQDGVDDVHDAVVGVRSAETTVASLIMI